MLADQINFILAVVGRPDRAFYSTSSKGRGKGGRPKPFEVVSFDVESLVEVVSLSCEIFVDAIATSPNGKQHRGGKKLLCRKTMRKTSRDWPAEEAARKRKCVDVEAAAKLQPIPEGAPGGPLQ